jgi:hypothetical protein
MNILIISFQNGTGILNRIEAMEKAFNISKIAFDREYLIIGIDDQEYRFRINTISDKLANADDKERNNYIVSPSGYGIHWPTLDEDLSINGLLNLLQNRHVA